ncbi:NAD(P)H-binding protein [Pedobacter nototheniae]|uniref:NAD(P)H-binding protein n=1 Tax=Pedobacter nototheniae TaxID=2488994 RepID=UPI00103A2804|nr:NAD(P)H-binding protein [Pedobacter nototheniae]
MKKAIIFGASGFIGSYLLEYLLKNPDYEQVIIVVRKALNISNPKLKMLIGDFNTLHTLRENLIADEIYIAIGTTKKSVPNEDQYYQIDHDYPVLAAKFAKENGAKSVSVVTAVGANAKSNMFYIKTKGEIERDIVALNFDYTHIFRPSMLMGNRKEHRPMEKVFMGIWSIINPILLGPLKKYKGINGSEVAKAMINSNKDETEKVKIYHWQEMTSVNNVK